VDIPYYLYLVDASSICTVTNIKILFSPGTLFYLQNERKIENSKKKKEEINQKNMINDFCFKKDMSFSIIWFFFPHFAR
jgi:hypothetical protein